MKKESFLPNEEHDFKALIESGGVYVDKTPYLQRFLERRWHFRFLARPKGFGKSMFLSMLRYFFEGQRYLFRNLVIESFDWEWAEYPVLYLDLNAAPFTDAEQFDNLLENTFQEWERKYDVKTIYDSFSIRFGMILKAAHAKTGKRAVVLVEEYDKPLIGTPENEDLYDHCCVRLEEIGLNYKCSQTHIQMVLLTGASCFFKQRPFCDVNNISDMSFSERSAYICGFTEKELHEYFGANIKELAKKMHISYEEVCEKLTEMYGGYRFTNGGEALFNPSSLLRCFNCNRIENYWTDTGYLPIIHEALKSSDEDLKKILHTRWSDGYSTELDVRNDYPPNLLYQGGYITIKPYDEEKRKYYLELANKEVSDYFFQALPPNYRDL